MSVSQKISIPDVVKVPIDQLKVDGQNPNRMTKKQLQALAESIKRFGFIIPIITNEELVVADGGQRLPVAKALGMIEVPVVRLPVRDVDRRILRQVLNKLRGEHRDDLDALEFMRIVEEGEKGTLQTLLNLGDRELYHALDMAKSKEVMDVDVSDPEATDIRRGDLFRLGPHRLLCGDALDIKDLSRLFGEERMSFLFADPPYNLPFPSEVVKYYLSRADTTAIMHNDGESAKHASQHDSFRYFLVGIRRMHATVNNVNLPLQHHSLIGVYQEKAYINHLSPPMTTVIDHIRRQVTDYEKNPYAFEKLLHAYTLPGDKVADVFAGRGNLMIVADQLGRVCYSMDIDPEMCQVIIDRWEKITGRKACNLGET